jgi:hypothetical protein
MKFFRTHTKILILLLIGMFFSVPLVTFADFSLSGIIISIVGYILYLAAYLFNAAIDLLVLQMGDLIRGTGGRGIGIGISIDIIWKIVRDLVNLTFIFGLVYVGFKTILNAGTDTKKLLSSIIIGALLVNFSLFITKVVIDVSNVTASEIYNQMGIGPNSADPRFKNFYIGEVFMLNMGIFNLVSVPPGTQGKLATQTVGSEIGTVDGHLALIVGGAAFILVAAFVFFAGTILLAIRFGILVILMMLSPIAFAATVFPVFKGWSEKWWHTLFSQAFFAPAYLFMLYVTLKVGEGYQNQTKAFDQIYTNAVGFFNDGFTTAIFFFLTIVLMVASLILAKQMGAYGGTRVLAVGKKLGSLARRGALSPVKALSGFAGRQTIGRIAESRLKKRTAAGKSSVSTMSRIYKSGAEAKFGGSLSRSQTEAAGKAAAQVKARTTQTATIASAVAADTAPVLDANGAPLPTFTPTQQRQRIEMEQAIANASNDQLLEIVKSARPTDPQYKAIVHNMSASQFDAVMNAKPEDLNDAAKAAFATARRDSVERRTRAAGRAAAERSAPGSGAVGVLSNADALKQGVSATSAAQLKALGTDAIVANAADLKQSQFEDIMKSKDYTETQQAAIADARKTQLIAKFTTSPTTFFVGMKDQDVAKLPREILTDLDAIDEMTPGMLARMQEELNATDRATIRTTIMSAPLHPARAWLVSPRGAEF